MKFDTGLDRLSKISISQLVETQLRTVETFYGCNLLGIFH